MSSFSSSLLPRCPYGHSCYRLNSDHRKEFDHDWDIAERKEEKNVTVAPSSPAAAAGASEWSALADDGDSLPPAAMSRVSRRVSSSSTTSSMPASIFAKSSTPTKPAVAEGRAATPVRAARARATTKAATASPASSAKKKASSTSKRTASKSPAAPVARASRARISATAAAAAAAPVASIPPVAAVAEVAADGDEESREMKEELRDIVEDAHRPLSPTSKFIMYARKAGLQTKKDIRIAAGVIVIQFVLGLLALPVILSHMESIEEKLRNCSGDLSFDCALRDMGRFTPLQVNGTCSAFTDIPSLTAQACHTFWWHSATATHPPLTCKEMCKHYGQSGWSYALLVSLFIGWIADIVFTIVPKPVLVDAKFPFHMSTYAVFSFGNDIFLVLFCSTISQSRYSFQMLFVLMSVGVRLFGPSVVLHALIVGDTSARHTKSRSRARRVVSTWRPMTTYETAEEGSQVFVGMLWAFLAFVDFCAIGMSDIGIPRTLWQLFTSWQVGGISWILPILFISTVLKAFYRDGKHYVAQEKLIADSRST